MIKLLPLIATIVFGSLTLSAAEPTKWATGRILVSPKPGLDDDEFDKIIKSHGAKSRRKIKGLNVYVVELHGNSHGKEQAQAKLLAKNPHMNFAEVDGVVSMEQFVPSDPYFGNAWHLPIIQAPAAWDTATGMGITIAILDGGVYSAHPDLAARMVPGWNFYDNNNNTSDLTGHGTKVAGVAAAIGNNAVGVTGGAWNSKIMPMRISDPTGSLTYYSIVADALTWAADHGARVANISYIVSHVPTVQTAAQYMRNKGGVVVVAAGNSGVLTTYANTSTMINVSATDSADRKASWSNYGPSVDVSAPGVGIWTTVMGGGYGASNGTSFASPLTASVVALMLSANPSLQPSQIDSLISSTAEDLGAVGRDDYFGHGRINAYRAVDAAKFTATTDTQAPSVSITSPTSGVVKGTVAVNVTAADNVGVSRIDLFVGGTLLASDTTSPYSFSWNTLTRADGATSLVAKAFDAAGNTTSHTVSVTVSNAVVVADLTPPTVTISNPINGSVVKGNVSINVKGTDNVAVTGISLYIDNVLKSSGTSSTLAYTWNTRKASSGVHSIKAVARDAAGNLNTQIIQVTK